MQSDREILEFVILDSFTPATLPMARLAEYITDLAIILGEKEHVHFVELRESSAAVVHAIDHEAVPKVRARVHAVKTGDAQPEAMKAQDRIEHRLRTDNAHGVLRPDGNDDGRLLYFPGGLQHAGTGIRSIQRTGPVVRGSHLCWWKASDCEHPPFRTAKRPAIARPAES